MDQNQDFFADGGARLRLQDIDAALAEAKQFLAELLERAERETTET